MDSRIDRSRQAIATRLIDAYDSAKMIDPITAEHREFDVEAAYDVLRRIEQDRHARGWRPVGCKIGFTNQTLWERYGVSGPMWARVWDRTVRVATEGVASISLTPFVQPRIEPEVVFGLGASPPASDDAEAILASVEWMAAGFEIVQCVFPGWRFTAADCTAAFGLHGALVVGTPVAVNARDRAAIAERLATFTATLSRDGSMVEQGSGANVLGSPALALGHLARIAHGQPQLAAPKRGEVVTTGTLTDARPVKPGERWSSDYGALGIEGLSVEFT